MIDPYELNRATYNRVARDWHKDHAGDDWWVEGTDAFVSFVESGDVLDVGCGAGTKSRYLARRQLHVTGIDFSPSQIDIAQEEVPEATFHVMDMREASKLGQTFHGLFAQASLLHVPRDEAPGVVQNLATLLNPGGVFYIAVKEPRQGQALSDWKTEQDYGYEYTRFFSFFTQEEIERMLKDAGLGIVWSRVMPSGNTRWVQVIGRAGRA